MLAEILTNLPKSTVSYMICATSRSGSSLLTTGITQTGIAGRPREYFNTGSIPRFAQEWGIDMPLNYIEYGRFVLEAGTKDQVFGVKVMFPDLMSLINNLKAQIDDNDIQNIDLLNSLFYNLRFLRISRKNKLAQAISQLKAEQTGVWGSNQKPKFDGTKDELTFDAQAIVSIIINVIRQEYRWSQFFAGIGFQPPIIYYEELGANYPATIKRALDYLDLPGADNVIIGDPVLEKQADEINAEWSERFLSVMGWTNNQEVRTGLIEGDYTPVLLQRLNVLNRSLHPEKYNKRQ